MHDLLGADDFTAKGFANGLVTQANAQEWFLAREVLQHLDGNACLRRRFRARRDADAVWIQRFDFRERIFNRRDVRNSPDKCRLLNPITRGVAKNPDRLGGTVRH